MILSITCNDIIRCLSVHDCGCMQMSSMLQNFIIIIAVPTFWNLPNFMCHVVSFSFLFFFFFDICFALSILCYSNSLFMYIVLWLAAILQDMFGKLSNSGNKRSCLWSSILWWMLERSAYPLSAWPLIACALMIKL